MQKKRRWPLIAGLAAAFLIVGIAVDLIVMSQFSKGDIEIQEALPSSAMMAHIAAHLDELCTDGAFTRTDALGTFTVAEYADPNGLSIMIQLESGAAPEDVLSAAPNWQGQYLGQSNGLTALFGSDKYLLSFVGTQGPLVMVVTQEDAAISNEPLEEAISLIQNSIGQP